MMELKTFVITSGKTEKELESALYNLAMEAPVFMAQVRPRLSREGFEWEGAISDFVRQSDKVCVKWDHRQTSVDFLVRSDMRDNEEYLSRNKKFVLPERRQPSSEQSRMGLLRRIFPFLRPRIRQKVWATTLSQLEDNKDSWTVCITFNNGEPEYTADCFVSGDHHTITVQKEDKRQSIERRDVEKLKLIKKPPATISDVGRTGTARVTFWRTKMENSGFGYLEDPTINEPFYFTSVGVLDRALHESLMSGKHGQIVEYRVIKGREIGNGHDGKYAVAQILRMLRDYVPSDPNYSHGHSAMISGNLEEAETYLLKALEQNERDPRPCVIKDLAEVYNRRGDPRKAYKLIERWRENVRETNEQISFDMMEVLYLERISGMDGDIDSLRTAVSKIEAVLAKTADGTSRKLHFERKKVRLEGIIRAMEAGDRVKSPNTQEYDDIVSTLSSDGITLAVTSRLRVAGLDSNFVGKLEAFARAISWKQKKDLRKDVENKIEELDIDQKSGNLTAAIRDAVDRKMKEIAEQKSPVRLLNRNDDSSLQLLDGKVEMRFALFLPDDSAVPLKNIAVFLTSEKDEQSDPSPNDGQAESWTLAHLSPQDGKFEVNLKYHPLKSEIVDGVCNIRACVKFDKDIPDDIADRIVDEKRCGTYEDRYSFRFKTGVGQGGFQPIVNRYEKYRNHVAVEDFFVGREELLDKIAEALISEENTGGQSFVLYGQDRSGKTSIRHNLQMLLEGKWKENLLYTETTGHGWTLNMLNGDPVQYMTYDLKVSAIKRLKDRGIWNNDMQALFDDIPKGYHAKKIEFLGKLLRANGIRWVVVIDEFTDLYDLLLRLEDNEKQKPAELLLDLLRVLKGLLEAREPILNLFLIGRDSMPQFKKDYWNEFAVSKPVRVTCLKEDAAKSLLQKLWIDYGVEIDEAALTRYYYYTGGYPFYSMLFCGRTVDYINDHQRLTLTGDDIDNIAISFCRGNEKLQPEEFNPFFALYDSSIDEDILVEVYYEVARCSGEDQGCPKNVFADKEEHLQVFKELEQRKNFHEFSNGTIRLKMELLGQYLRDNPGLTYDDFRAAWVG